MGNTINVNRESIEWHGKDWFVISVETNDNCFRFASEELFNEIEKHPDSCIYGGKFGKEIDSKIYYYTNLIDLNLDDENFVRNLIDENADFSEIFFDK